jgi:hypothetical protein
MPVVCVSHDDKIPCSHLSVRTKQHGVYSSCPIAMLAQRASGIAAGVFFLLLSARLVFMIPKVGVLLGFCLLFAIFTVWYFVLQRDFFRSPIVDFIGKIVPVALVMLALAATIMGILGVFSWLPPSLSSAPLAPQNPMPGL